MPSRPTTYLLPALLLSASLLLASRTTPAQLANKGPAAAIALAKTLAPYDISTIKQNDTSQPDQQRSGISVHDDVFIATNVTLEFLLQFAYDVKANQITGLTGPVASRHFDIMAKVLPSADGIQSKLTDQQLVAMMIPLLAVRFRLRAHVEPKIAPVYDLVVAKRGIKLKLDASPRTSSGWDINSENASKVLTSKNASMDDLASTLSDIADRKVIDKTALPGHADITLKWSDDVALTQSDTNAISIFTAVEEQLGLKLQPSKGPIDTLVIDHVDMPSQN